MGDMMTCTHLEQEALNSLCRFPGDPVSCTRVATQVTFGTKYVLRADVIFRPALP